MGGVAGPAADGVNVAVRVCATLLTRTLAPATPDTAAETSSRPGARACGGVVALGVRRAGGGVVAWVLRRARGPGRRLRNVENGAVTVASWPTAGVSSLTATLTICGA